MKALQKPDITEVVVTTADGKQWVCEYDGTQLIPIKEVGGSSSPPPPMPMPSPPMSAKYEPRTIEDVLGDNEELDEDEQEDVERMIADPPKMDDNVFRARLRSIMTDNMFDRKTRGRTRGKLDMQRLWKARVGATNLFTQMQSRKNKQYNIVLLIDESGSMREDEKIKYAAEVACFLAKSFAGINLDLSIVGFNKFLVEHKTFNEEVRDFKQLHETIVTGAYDTGSGYNNDYDAMSYAYRLFNNRKGQNFLIMLSDGQPATSSIDSYIKNPKVLQKKLAEKNLEVMTNPDVMGREHKLYIDTSTKLTGGERNQKQHLHALVHANPHVDSLGIGIQSDNWQMPNHINEDDLDKLKPILLREIQRKVRRG